MAARAKTLILIPLVSLVAATLVLGALSFRTAHLVRWTRVRVNGPEVRERSVNVAIYNGRLLASISRGVVKTSNQEGAASLVAMYGPGLHWQAGPPRAVINLEWEGSGRYRAGVITQVERRPGNEVYRVAMPFWIPPAMFAIPLAIRAALRANRRRRRRRAGRCVECGYDLRGHSSANDPCPECGHAVAGGRNSASLPPTGARC